MGFRLPQWRQSGRHALQSLASMPREGGASTLSDICESLSLNRTIAVLCVQSISIGADSRWGRGGVEPPITGLRLRRRAAAERQRRSEEHTSELQSLMRNSYAVFLLKKK